MFVEFRVRHDQRRVSPQIFEKTSSTLLITILQMTMRHPEQAAQIKWIGVNGSRECELVLSTARNVLHILERQIKYIPFGGSAGKYEGDGGKEQADQNEHSVSFLFPRLELELSRQKKTDRNRPYRAVCRAAAHLTTAQSDRSYSQSFSMVLNEDKILWSEGIRIQLESDSQQLELFRKERDEESDEDKRATSRATLNETIAALEMRMKSHQEAWNQNVSKGPLPDISETLLFQTEYYDCNGCNAEIPSEVYFMIAFMVAYFVKKGTSPRYHHSVEPDYDLCESCFATCSDPSPFYVENDFFYGRVKQVPFFNRIFGNERSERYLRNHAFQPDFG